MTEAPPFNDKPVDLEDEDTQVALMKQTALISWRELQRFFAAGKVIEVGKDLDLVSVGVALVEDDTQSFSDWTGNGLVRPIPDEVAAELVETDTSVWALAVAPWVLIQKNAKDQ